MQKLQPLIVRTYTNILSSNNAHQLFNTMTALPHLVQQLNDSLLKRDITHLPKYSGVFDWLFRKQEDRSKVAEQLNKTKFNLFTELLVASPKEQLVIILAFVYSLQNLLRYSDVELCKAAMSRLADSLDTEDQRVAVLVVIKCGIYKPQIITSVIIVHPSARYFTQLLLQTLNKPLDTYQLNLGLRFVISVYSKTDEFFYNNDLTVLVDILLRSYDQPQTPSKTIDYCLQCYIGLTCCRNFNQLRKHRPSDIHQAMRTLQSKYPEFQQIISEISGAVGE